MRPSRPLEDDEEVVETRSGKSRSEVVSDVLIASLLVATVVVTSSLSVVFDGASLEADVVGDSPSPVESVRAGKLGLCATTSEILSIAVIKSDVEYTVANLESRIAGSQGVLTKIWCVRRRAVYPELNQRLDR